jgi:tripartite-type tricarboxylate transporter receptor subunit TctC
MSGRIEVGFAALNNVKSYVAAGKLRLLAIAESGRYPPLAGTPTIPEIVPAFIPPPSWNGIVGPAAMPRPVVDRLNGALVRAMETPEVRAFLEQNGAVSRAGTPEDLAATLRKDFEIAGRQLKAAAIQAE